MKEDMEKKRQRETARHTDKDRHRGIIKRYTER